MILRVIAGAVFVLWPTLVASQSQPAPAVPQADTCTVDPDGTEHVTRVVPVPGTISQEAQTYISRPRPSGPEPPLAERRASTDKFRIGRAEEARKLYPVKVEGRTIAGVRCDVITPLTISAQKRNRVLINVHGGGFVSDSGSLVEGIPIANLTGTTVVSVYYRLAPEYPFPAAVEDTVAVYRELLKRYKPEETGLFGTSAGAILTAEVAVALRQRGLPLPAALGIFSGSGDLSQAADSEALYTIHGFTGHLTPPSKGPRDTSYIGRTNPRDTRTVAALRGPARLPAHAVCHQHARPLAKWDDYSSSDLSARWRGRGARCLRGLAARVLVRLSPARSEGSAGYHGKVL
jgi:acetyl esterase/lipase